MFETTRTCTGGWDRDPSRPNTIQYIIEVSPFLPDGVDCRVVCE